MKYTLAVLLVLSLVLTGGESSAQTVDSSTRTDFQMKGGRIQKIRIQSVVTAKNDTVVLEASAYYPPELDSATAFAIMKQGKGSAELNYRPVWNNNPLWFLYQTPKIIDDSYSYDGSWQPVTTGVVQTPLYGVLGLWLLLIFVVLMIVPVLIRLIIAIFNIKTRIKLWFFCFSIIASFILSYTLVDDRYWVPQYYGYSFTRMEMYKHYYLFPVVIFTIIYLGRWMWIYFLRLFDGKGNTVVIGNTKFVKE